VNSAGAFLQVCCQFSRAKAGTFLNTDPMRAEKCKIHGNDELPGRVALFYYVEAVPPRVLQLIKS
jgi:hypothetical protein